MSGDTVAITLFHDRNSLVDVETDVITRNESQVVNDALREDDEGLYLLSQNGRRLSVSQSEFIRAGVEVGSPVQVIAPVWLPIDGQSHLITTFCRIIKRLEDTPLRLRTSVGSVEKRHGQHGEAPALELVPLFTGQTILVVGGDGLQTGFQAVIQSMGGNFDWQSGFGQLSRIPDRIRSADVVVIVTGSVYHAASGLAINEARRTNTPIHYLNTLGRASFIRFLSEIAASREYTVTSTAQSSNMTNECMASSVSS